MDRKDYIGASELAAAIGWSQYRTARDVWEEKTGRRQPVEDSAAILVGKALEPVILELVSERIPIAQSGANWSIELRVPDSPIVAHPDAIAADGRPVEIKTTGILSRSNSYRDVPIDYLLQVYCQAYALGKDSGWLVWLVGGEGLRVKLIEVDIDTLQVAIELAREFWMYVETDTPPPEQPASSQVKPVRPTKVSDDKFESLLVEYIEIQERRRELERREDEIKKSIVEHLADRESLRVGSFEVTRKVTEVARLDAAKLREKFPDVYATCIGISKQSRLTVREVKP